MVAFVAESITEPLSMKLFGQEHVRSTGMHSKQIADGNSANLEERVLQPKKAACIFLTFALIFAGNAQALDRSGRSLANRDVKLSFVAGQHQPQLEKIEAVSGEVLRNLAAEELPGAVEVNGQTINVQWELRADAGEATKRQLE